MRAAIASGLLVAAGCNQIFGIQKTETIDGTGPGIDAPPDAPYRRVHASYLVADIDANGPTAPTLAPIPNATLRIGPLDGPLVAAAYDAGDSGVAVPDEIEASGKRWRLEVSVPNLLVHEYQFASGANANITLPRQGRLERLPIPASPSVAFVQTTPTGYPQFNTHTHAWFTTGMWSTGTPSVAKPQPQSDLQWREEYRCMESSPNCTLPRALDGELGALDPTRDAFILADYVTTTCTRMVGSTNFRSALDMTAPSSTWFTEAPQTATGPNQNGATLTAQVTQAMSGNNGSSARWAIGAIPNVEMPATTLAADAEWFLAHPLAFDVVQCPVNSAPSDTEKSHVNAELAKFKIVPHLEAALERELQTGALLRFGATWVGAPITPPGLGFGDVKFFGPYPTTISLDGVDLHPKGSYDENVAIATPPRDLTFIGSADTADYWDITIVEIVGTQVRPKRLITVPGATGAITVKVDGVTFETGHTYVFEIRSFVGAPDAREANFQRYQLPQATMTVVSDTFKIQ